MNCVGSAPFDVTDLWDFGSWGLRRARVRNVGLSNTFAIAPARCAGDAAL
jgi:hypothetical protein